MMNKRLIDFVPESRKFIAGNVALQWVSLLANIGMMTAITLLLAALFEGTANGAQLAGTAILAALAVAVRFACTTGASRMGFLSSRTVNQNHRLSRWFALCL